MSPAMRSSLWMVTVTYFLDSFALVACKTDERSLVGVSPTPPDVMRQRPYGWKGAKRQRSRIAIHTSVAGPGPKAPWGRARGPGARWTRHAYRRRRRSSAGAASGELSPSPRSLRPQVRYIPGLDSKQRYQPSAIKDQPHLIEQSL